MKFNLILSSLLYIGKAILASAADGENQGSIIELYALGENATNSADICEDITNGAEKLKDALSSSMCELDLSGNIEPAWGYDVNDLYDAYYGFCGRVCTCSYGRNLSEDKVSTKTLVPVGECDAVVEALLEVNDKMDYSLECELTTANQGFLYDFFCEDPDGNPSGSICAGYSGFCFRRALVEDGKRHLEEIDNLTAEDIRDEIKSLGANADGAFGKKHNGLPTNVCNDLVNVLEEDVYSNRRQTDLYGNRNLKLTGEELVSTIGKDNAKDLLKFFHDTLGYEAPITKINIQQAEPMDEETAFTGHVDGLDTMIVFLKSNVDNEDLQGGGIYHYTGEGLEKTEEITQGMTVVHGKDVVHKTFPWTGTRYILDIASDPGRKWASCMLADLVN